MLTTLLSLQTRLKICNSNWTNSTTLHVSKGSSSTLTKQKSRSSSAGVFQWFPRSRTTAHLWNLSLNSNTLESLLLVMEACSQLLSRWQTTSGLPLPEFTELVTARVSSTENMPCYGFSRSLLWQLVFTVVKYGPLLHWHMIPQKSLPHMSFIFASEKTPGCQEKHDTHCVLRKTGQMPIFFYWFRCIIRFWNSLPSSNNPLREKVVQADLLIANRSDTWNYQVLHALQDFPTSQQFLNAIRSRESIHLK